VKLFLIDGIGHVTLTYLHQITNGGFPMRRYP